MIKIGITGSLSSGKSAVAKLMSRNKYPLFDADKVVVGLYKKRDFIKKIKKKFNFKNTKNLKRKVKNLIKKDKKKLKELESIIHPLVRKEMKTLMKPRKNIKISIFEIPLLIESKLTKYFDVVVFVDANKNIRFETHKLNPKVFITTVGLYNDAFELMAIAKLSQPVAKDFTKEALIRVKLDY